MRMMKDDETAAAAMDAACGRDSLLSLKTTTSVAAFVVGGAAVAELRRNEGKIAEAP